MVRTVAGLALALSLSIALLASVPARLISSFVPSGQVLMQGVSGTLWRGHASRVLIRSASGYLHLGRVNWHLSPLSLLWFSPRISLDSSWGSQSITGQVVFGAADRLELVDIDAVIDARLLRHYAPLELSGTVSLRLQQLTLRGGAPEQGSGRLVWREGGWVSAQGRRPLGSYALDFEQAAGGPLEGEVITLAGDVQAGGSVRLQERNYDVNILLGGPGLSDQQLRQALQLLAVPEGESYRVKLQGAF